MMPAIIILCAIIVCQQLFIQDQKATLSRAWKDSEFYRDLWGKAEASLTTVLDAWKTFYNPARQRKLEKAYRAQCKTSYKRSNAPEMGKRKGRTIVALIQNDLYAMRLKWPEDLDKPYWLRRIKLLQTGNKLPNRLP